MLFLGTAALDGAPVPSGSLVQAYDQAGNLLGQTTTGSLPGAVPDYWQLVTLQPQLEDRQALFYLVSGGRRMSPAATATYNTQGLGSGLARVTIAALTSRTPEVVLGSLMAARAPDGSPLLSIAWSQDLLTGEYRFFAPGAVSSMAAVEPNTAIFLNLAQPLWLRVSARPPVLVPSGGAWVAIGDVVSIEVAPLPSLLPPVG
jgi:hypothetical protein